MRPWVYILECADGHYYVGSFRGDDPEVRESEHNDGKHPTAWTYSRRPVTLVWAGEFQRVTDAIAFEQQIKRWSRAKKEAVIRGEWTALKGWRGAGRDSEPTAGEPGPSWFDGRSLRSLLTMRGLSDRPLTSLTIPKPFRTSRDNISVAWLDERRKKRGMDQTLTKPPLDVPAPGLGPRQYGAVNWLGLWTLCLRETRRFWKVGMQTLFAPVVSSLLMLFVFKLAFGQGSGATVGGVPFEVFLAPGVVMMAILNNAFANTSSSLIIAKVQGNSVDFLMPPLSPMELTVGFLSGAVSRGILVGIVTYAAVWIMQITPFQVANLFAVIYFAVIASLLMGAVGLLGGIWADKFDHMAAVQNFVIMPLTMLSGTFYPISRLPEPFVTISHYNPFFQIIDGFRYGFTGQAEGDLWLGGLMTAAITLGLCAWCWAMLKRGYKLKA